MKGYANKVSCLSWHPSIATIASAGGNDVVLWTMPRSGGNAKGQPLRHHSSTITALRWSTDGSYLASADRAGRLCIWNANGEVVHSQQFEREITVLYWQPGDTALLAGDTGGGLHRLVNINATGGATDKATGREAQ
jgi:WD40 repeat protein